MSLLAFFSLDHYRAETIKICYLPQKKAKLSSLYFNFLIFVLLFMLCFKATTVGVDTPGYREFYEYTVDQDLVYDRSWGLFDQPLYYFTLKALKTIGFNFRTAVAVIYICSMMPLAFFAKKYSKNPSQVLLLYLCLGFFAIYASALRQVMAMAFGYLAVLFQTKERNVKNYLVSGAFILLATLIHNTAIILLIGWVVTLLFRNKRSVFIFASASALVAIIFPSTLIKLVGQQVVGDIYDDVFGISSNVLLILVYVCIAVLTLWQVSKTDYLQTTKNRNIFINAFLAIICMLLSSKIFMLSRLSYYFLLPLCCVFSDSLDNLCKERLGKLLYYITIVLFVLLFVFGQSSDSTGIFPYHFMWEKQELWN